MVKKRGDGVLVVFDLVATLTDAGPRYARAFQDVCESTGNGRPAADEVLSMLGNKNLKEITDRFVGEMDEHEKKDFMNACNQACDAMLYDPDWHEDLYPHAREAVETLSLQGVTLGIYTATREDAMESQMAFHDIAGFFANRYTRGKDNERDKGMKNAELKSKQLRDIVDTYRKDAGDDAAPVIVIGDSSADAQAAKDLGLYFVGFAATEKKKQKMEAAGVKTIFTDYADLPDIVERLLNPPVNDNAANAQLRHRLKPPKP